MAEWLYEHGIGEDRAILVENGEIVEAVIELPGLRTGAVIAGRLTALLIPGRRAIATLANGEEALIEPVPPGLTEGMAFNAEILRETIPEHGRPKRAFARPTDDTPRTGASLADRISTAPIGPHGPDLFELAGWSELLTEAATGEIAFPGGALRMSLTPAMTLFDVDGILPPPELAERGAAAAARAIRRLRIGGSIGIDLPTVPDKAARLRAAAAVDAILPQPFERTAVNGFGFLQIVRRRTRPSLPEIMATNPAGAAARALLRRAERSIGPVTLTAAAPVIMQIEANPDWRDALARRTGGAVALQPETGLSIWAGHVHQG